MNNINFIGNVSKVPYFIEAKGNKKAVAYLTVANNDEEVTIFVEVAVFGKTAEYVKEYISTGALISIEGKLSFRPKKTKNEDAYKEAYILCNRLRNLSKRNES